MNTTCENCKGGGLVGGGDEPWLKEGAISTCIKCSGKGIIPDVVPEVPEKAPDEESSVDNSNENTESSEMNEEEKKIDVAEDKGDSVVE